MLMDWLTFIEKTNLVRKVLVISVEPTPITDPDICATRVMRLRREENR